MNTEHNQKTQEFRSATEFPTSIQELDIKEADRVYCEIRQYLVSTNRSQGQLRRYNESYRQDISKYRDNISDLQKTRDNLQLAINQLTAEKKELLNDKSEAIELLEQEVTNLSGNLDTLSEAFEGIIDFDDPNVQWASTSFMTRVWNFLKSVRLIVRGWNIEDQLPSTADHESLPPSRENIAMEERENPRMYTDPASINRALRDDTG
ncbi:hypothetical protein [Acaryochloris sp. CCMEE 5410]|uniref:hypothetical protein n=1 Tax=Acaryochloris sp. CCMEE 5410 TaxID=310037 RepID=UPI000248398F|nr:hypothetical protein [Acaryochloris sp. CCMEE 5410]KAI9135116.1 hypothetical protein ON05_018955 [Acaryochloris sp. CCMEE 5410]